MIRNSIRLFLLMAVVCGLVYPLVMTTLAQILFQDSASGTLIYKNGTAIGSRHIAQPFKEARYFWPRPSASEFSAWPSSGSNLSWSSQELKSIIEERKNRWTHLMGEVPSDLLFASGSGLDPHITKKAALFQVDQIIHARGLNPQYGPSLHKLIEEKASFPFMGLFGEPYINVLELNLILDERF